MASIHEASTRVFIIIIYNNVSTYTEFGMLISSQNTELETLQTLNIYVYESLFFLSNFISTVFVCADSAAVSVAAAAAEYFALCIR